MILRKINEILKNPTKSGNGTYKHFEDQIMTVDLYKTVYELKKGS